MTSIFVEDARTIAIAAFVWTLCAYASPSSACRYPAPPQSFCGDPGCGTVVCLTADNSWDCRYATRGTSCDSGAGRCDGGGYCQIVHSTTGFIDGVNWSGGQLVVSGWACASGLAQPVTVQLEAIGNTGDWVVSTATANLPSELAVAQACNAPGATTLRFSFVVPTPTVITYQGLGISVRAMSPDGGTSNLTGNSGSMLFEMPLGPPPVAFILPPGPTNPPFPPMPVNPFELAPALASSQWLVTDYWPLSTFTPRMLNVAWQGVSAAAAAQPTLLVQNGAAVVPTVTYSNFGGFLQSNLPTIRALPSVRRRVYWAPVNSITNQATADCPKCTCSLSTVTVNNNDSLTQACAWLTGLADAKAQQWTESLGAQSAPAPIDALKSILQQLSFNVTHSSTETITITSQLTQTETFNCTMAPGFLIGFYDQCALWQLHEVYDIVGPDGQPWSDPVYQVRLPAPIDNPLNTAWLSTYFDCTKGMNSCAVIPNP